MAANEASDETETSTAPLGETPDVSADKCGAAGGRYYNYNGSKYCFLSGHSDFNTAKQECIAIGGNIVSNGNETCSVVAARYTEDGVPNYSCLTYWIGAGSGVCCEIDRSPTPTMSGVWKPDNRDPNGKLCKM